MQSFFWHCLTNKYTQQFRYSILKLQFDMGIMKPLKKKKKKMKTKEGGN